MPKQTRNEFYRSSTGNFFEVSIEVTNADATITNGGQRLWPVITGQKPKKVNPPPGLRMRYANAYRSDKPRHYQQFYLGEGTSWRILANQDSPKITAKDNAETGAAANLSRLWIVTSLVGERILEIAPWPQ